MEYLFTISTTGDKAETKVAVDYLRRVFNIELKKAYDLYIAIQTGTPYTETLPFIYNISSPPACFKVEHKEVMSEEEREMRHMRAEWEATKDRFYKYIDDGALGDTFAAIQVCKMIQEHPELLISSPQG